MLLPGGRDVSQSRLADQLSLCSPSLYEESLLQHWDHVSKRNKFVGTIHRCSLCERLDLTCGCRKLITWIFGYANALYENLNLKRWMVDTNESSKIPLLPSSTLSNDIAQRTSRTVTVLVSRGPVPRAVLCGGQSVEKP